MCIRDSPCCDLDTRDDRVSLSQSTEVTVAESDKDAINPRANLLPVAINSPQPVRRTPDGRLDAIQSRALIGRESARACAEHHVNGIFVYGSRAHVVLNNNYEFASCGWQRCNFALGGEDLHHARRPPQAGGTHSGSAESGGMVARVRSRCPTSVGFPGVRAPRRFPR